MLFAALLCRARLYSAGHDDKSIRVWDISTLTHTHTLDAHTDWVTGIALTQDEQHLVSCSHDESLKVWCTTSLSCLRTVQLDCYPSSLAVSQPGDVIAVVTRQSDTIALYRLSTGECLGKVGLRGAWYWCCTQPLREVGLHTQRTTLQSLCVLCLPFHLSAVSFLALRPSKLQAKSGCCWMVK